jgi:putative phosphoesterase
MLTVGLISDTHSFLDPTVFDHFKDCDEIWHAGDIGEEGVLLRLAKFKPIKAVFGNIDDRDLRLQLPEDLFFEAENLRILITHIGATPPGYNSRIKGLIKKYDPNLFICGHSHILRVIKDPRASYRVYINPGAAGKQGFHSVRTVMRMQLDIGRVVNLEVIELGRR